MTEGSPINDEDDIQDDNIIMITIFRQCWDQQCYDANVLGQTEITNMVIMLMNIMIWLNKEN